MLDLSQYANRKRLPRLQHDNGMKACNRCRRWVPLIDFSNDAHFWDGFRPCCNSCSNSRRREQAHTRGVRPHDQLRVPYNDQGQKWCKVCRRWREPVKFAIDKTKWDTRSTRCKECDAAWHRQERKIDPTYVRQRARKYQTTKYVKNIQYRLRITCKNRIWWALKGVAEKAASTVALIGCSIADLKLHLESGFQPGMSWQNYGLKGWHIGHIRDCCSFDLTDPAQQRQCFHHTNLEPQWAGDNLSKPRDKRRK